MKTLLSFQQLKQKKGFTLIELMIVISIIGILATAGVGAMFFTSRDRARDAATIKSVKELATGLETYYSVNRRYTTISGANTGCPFTGNSDYFPNGISGITLSNQNCRANPVDYFCICAQMKVVGSGNDRNPNCGYAPLSVDTPGHFCVESLQ